MSSFGFLLHEFTCFLSTHGVRVSKCEKLSMKDPRVRVLLLNTRREVYLREGNNEGADGNFPSRKKE